MAHDKIRAAARKRMAQTGEPYSAARRAVVCGHQADGPDSPPPGAGFTTGWLISVAETSRRPCAWCRHWPG